MSKRQKINPAELRRLIEGGATTAQIADHFGVQSPAVCRACHANGLPLPLGRVGRHGEPSRADDEIDLGMLRAAADGDAYHRIAARFGVSHTTVHKRVEAVEAADLAESGEPVQEVARHYPRHRRGGWR